MQSCPVCHESNPPEAKLCRGCGSVFRRAELVKGSRRPLRLLLALGALLAVPLFAVSIFRQADLDLTYYGTELYAKGPDFRGQDVAMKRIEPTFRDGYVEVSLAEIENWHLVQFHVPLQTMNMPIIAYVGPTGRLVTAFGWCELCQTTGYHFESNTLVCDKCQTTWALEGDGTQPQDRPSHFGFAGNCRHFGPEFIEHQVVDGPQGKLVRISLARIRQWTPRTGGTEHPRS